MSPDKKGESRIGGRQKLAKSITANLLGFLLEMADNFIICLDRKELYRRVYNFSDQKWSNEKTSKFLNNLMRRGYLEIERDGISESIRFTTRAKLALIDKIVEGFEDDRCHYFISFDIPERLKVNRDKFRRAIKRIGFKEVQKSLWVCNKNIGQFVEELAEEYCVSDYVVYLVSKVSNIDQSLEKISKA